ncbi:MAG: hypothetical protein ABIE94_04160 [archaeon]
MKKKTRLIIFIIIAILIALPFLIQGYNSIAKKQREPIKYCVVDEDCAIKLYVLYPCGGWATCFNKDEKPMNDVTLGMAACDYPPDGCTCQEGECLTCVGEHCH